MIKVIVMTTTVMIAIIIRIRVIVMKTIMPLIIMMKYCSRSNNINDEIDQDTDDCNGNDEGDNDIQVLFA